MGISYSFIDNEVYGAEDVNALAQKLTGAGVMPFAAKDSYNVSDLNVLTSALIEAGVQLDGCKCTAEETGANEILINVSKGIVFFECGVCMTVDEDGYMVSVPKNIEGYIFAYFSPSLQTGDIVFERSLPSDGEYVLLAQIKDNIGMLDARKFARAKVATLGRNVCEKIEFSKRTKAALHLNSTYYNEYIVAEISGIDISKFNYAVICTDGTFKGSNGANVPALGQFMVFFNIAENKIDFGADSGKLWNANRLYQYGDYWMYMPKIINGKLYLICRCIEGKAANVINYAPNCTALLM